MHNLGVILFEIYNMRAFSNGTNVTNATNATYETNAINETDAIKEIHQKQIPSKSLNFYLEPTYVDTHVDTQT